MTPQADPPMQQGSWFSRNWKWLVPVGCMVPMVCCGVFGLGTYMVVTKVIQSSGAYAGALAMVNQSSEVQEILGTPVTPGFGMSGKVEEKSGSGSADFTVPISGSKGAGSMHVVASRGGGEWNYTVIDVVVGGKTINVLMDPNNVPDVPPEDSPEEPDEKTPEEPDGD
jgi:hypothetical protein